MDYSCIVNLPWFNFILGLNFIFFYFWEQCCMVMSLKQKKVQFKPRIKLNHNKSIKKTTDMLNVTLRQQYFYFSPTINWTFFQNHLSCHTKERARQKQSCPILQQCYGPLRAFDRLYIQYKLSALLTVCF